MLAFLKIGVHIIIIQYPHELLLVKHVLLMCTVCLLLALLPVNVSRFNSSLVPQHIFIISYGCFTSKIYGCDFLSNEVVVTVDLPTLPVCD